MKNKRKLVLLSGAAIAVTMAVMGVAYAYFTTTGSGTGSGAIGAGSPLALHGTIVSAMLPGASSPVSFTVDNSSAGHQLLGTIHLASVAVDSSHSGCVTSDFTMPDIAANQDIPSGDATAVTAQGTLSMANTNVSQDACSGAALTLNLTSS